MPKDPIDIRRWRTLLRKGNLDTCLQEVSNWTQQLQQFIEESRTLQSRYGALDNKRKKNTISDEKYNLGYSRITDETFKLIDDIHQSTLRSTKQQLAPVSEDELGFREALSNILPPEVSHLEVLSEGDYNVVYKARRYVGTELEDEVAIKAFKNISLIQDESAKKLEYKFGLAQKYSNMDGIVTIFSNNMKVFPQFYIMRYITGLDLDHYLDQDWPMSLFEKKRLLRKMAEALKKGHQDDLLHLNLRPSNVKIDADGDPQLLPFQIVQFNFSRQNIKRIKRLVTYWSPEQVNGGDLSGQTDQYALGLIAYELFTKKPLFSGDTVLEIIQRRFEVDQTMAKFYEDNIPDVLQKELEATHCPPFFIDTIRQMLQYDPGLRFPDMDELLDEIESIEAPRKRIKADFKLLERSLSRCRKKEQFYTNFYANFFKKRPDYEALFERVFIAKERKGRELPVNYEDQTPKLDEKKIRYRWQFQHKMLDLAMDRILLFHQDTKQISPRMGSLAKSHVDLGIPVEDFSVFLLCMKETLVETDHKTWEDPTTIDKLWEAFTTPVLKMMKSKA